MSAASPQQGGSGGILDLCRVSLNMRLRNQTFFPGNIVEGVLEVDVKKAITYCGIRMKLVGKETVRMEREVERPVEYDAAGHVIPSTKQPKKISTKESIVYTKQLITLAGDLKNQADREGAFYKGEHSFELVPGRYSYPIAWQLPKNLPSSFSKRVGLDDMQVVYYIKAFVIRPGGQREVTKKAYINVVRPIPRSQWLAGAPVAAEKSFPIRLCCCLNKGTVAAKISIVRTLVATERDNLELSVEFDCTNSKQEVHGVIIWLTHRMTYIVQNTQNTIELARLLAESEKRRRHRPAVGERTNPQIEKILSPDEEESRVLGIGKAVTHTVEVARRHVSQTVRAGAKEVVNCFLPLPRDIIDPSFATYNMKSDYGLDVELLVPYSEEPLHSFQNTIVVVQAVDPTNASKPLYFREANYTRLPKGKLDVPEVYYNLPPDPCASYRPIPFECPPVIPRYDYVFEPSPIGIPGPSWQLVLPRVHGEDAELCTVPPLKPWQRGIGQFVCQDINPPKVEGFALKKRAAAKPSTSGESWSLLERNEDGDECDVNDDLMLKLPEPSAAHDSHHHDELLVPLVGKSSRAGNSNVVNSLYGFDDNDDPLMPFSSGPPRRL